MKNTSLFRRSLSVILALTMLFSLLAPVASAEPTKAAGNQVRELTLKPSESGAPESLKLGRTSEKESIPMEDHALTEKVRVSIFLDRASTIDAGFSLDGIANNTLAKVYRTSLRIAQDAMTARIEKAIGSKLDVQWNLTLAANCISANVLYGQIETIQKISGVRTVVLEPRYEVQKDEKEAERPNNGASSHMIGSHIAWAAGLTGAGSRLAVIDTGIDVEHQSFSGEALEYAFARTAEEKGMSYDEYVASLNLLDAEKINAVKDQLNVKITGEKAYVSTKIPYAYCYVDQDYDVTHENDEEGEHGSHVEGISAANRFVKIDGEFKDALEAVGTQGVAPDAQIITMKVFGNGGGAYATDYMAAIEDAIILGCDSANLSLGSSAPGFGFTAEFDQVMNKLVESGMVCSISMGNAYGWYDNPAKNDMYPYLYTDDVSYHTGGSPGTFTNSLAVASSKNSGQYGPTLMFGDRMVIYNESTAYGNEAISTLGDQELEYVLVDGVGVDDNDHVGQEGDQFLALGSEVLSGKVAMCYRGSSSFFAKA
ncbi:MAG: S8 family serine peptidase, partial [Bacteroidales bacterium]|nr:S8 family serine peptidase [Bacteroidales bacterium]